MTPNVPATVAFPYTPLKNTGGTTLSKLAPIQLKADGTIEKGVTTCFGLMLESTPNQSVGRVQYDGIVYGTPSEWDAVTGQSNGLTAGSFYYLSSTGLTTTPNTILVGLATRVNNLLLLLGRVQGLAGDTTFTRIFVLPGTLVAPAITVIGDLDTGIYFPAANTIAFALGGLELVKITSAGQVQIGIPDASAVAQMNIRCNANGQAFSFANLNYAFGGGTGTNVQTSFGASVGNTFYREQVFVSGGTAAGNFAVQNVGGRFGVGGNTAFPGKLTVTNFTLNSANISPTVHFEAPATNDDPHTTLYQNRITTTDATVTSIFNFGCTDNYVHVIEAHVVGRRTGGTGGVAGDAISVRIIGTFRRSGSVVTQIGATTIVHSVQDNVNCNVAFNPAGVDPTLVYVEVTGDVDNNYVWHINFYEQKVGS